MHTLPPVTITNNSTNSPTTNPMAKYASLTEQLHSVELSVVCVGESVTVVYTVEVSMHLWHNRLDSLGFEHGR